MQQSKLDGIVKSVEIRPDLDPASEAPLYRQLCGYIAGLIHTGVLAAGDRVPPTRELAGQLGLNRTTVSAAYELLEQEGLIKGEVGRGSYVCARRAGRTESLDWARLMTPSIPAPAGGPANGVIDFTRSRPSENLFPLEEFRASCREVLEGQDLKHLMQLGSPGGYEPLRRYILNEATAAGIARGTDDVLITNGCQQALDLMRRAFVRSGDRVAIEDPVYPGLRNLFAESGAELIGMPVGRDGVDPADVERAMAAGANIIVLTPSHQNPTGAAVPVASRTEICRIARAGGVAVVENDIYSELSVAGADAPRLKQLDSNVILLGSFSKMAFPGIRVGWVIGPRAVIARATELKQLADLHTDHLSQAFLLRFAESGRLARHCERTIAAAREKLRALDQACRRHLTDCRWNVPGGGMNMWVELPEPMDAFALRAVAQQAGMDYLPGRYFAVSRPFDSGLRLSFGGLEPDEIRQGIEVLGGLVQAALQARRERDNHPALALV